MQHFEVKQGKSTYTFYCDSRGTRHGFKHVCELYVDGYHDADATCYYLNRTWECYKYQSAMLAAIGNLIEQHTQRLMEQFKDENGYARMTAKRCDEFQRVLDADEIMQELQAVEQKVNEGF